MEQSGQSMEPNAGDLGSGAGSEIQSGTEGAADTTDADTNNAGTETNNPDVADTASPGSATYSLTFQADWSVVTHATNFPPDPHFSGLVGAVHNEQVIFWEPGQLATSGIEVVAESGSKSSFLDEINAVISDGRALSEISGGGIATSPGEQTISFEVTLDYPQITVVSMLAPSPDWIVGVHNLNLVDASGFIDSLEIDLPLYDAGTDSGSGYTSSNSDTQPPDTISLLTSDSADTNFIEGLPLVGKFIIVRQ